MRRFAQSRNALALSSTSAAAPYSPLSAASRARTVHTRAPPAARMVVSADLVSRALMRAHAARAHARSGEPAMEGTAKSVWKSTVWKAEVSSERLTWRVRVLKVSSSSMAI